jgi:hypothetical protein
LDSVKQIEENLKRFKRKNTVSGTSDETKVRTQIKIDMEDFLRQIQSFGVEILGGELESNLKKVVEESFAT